MPLAVGIELDSRLVMRRPFVPAPFVARLRRARHPGEAARPRFSDFDALEQTWWNFFAIPIAYIAPKGTTLPINQAGSTLHQRGNRDSRGTSSDGSLAIAE